MATISIRQRNLKPQFVSVRKCNSAGYELNRAKQHHQAIKWQVIRESLKALQVNRLELKVARLQYKIIRSK